MSAVRVTSISPRPRLIPVATAGARPCAASCQSISKYTPVTIGYNLPSKKIGKKGIIKVANKYFTDEEINRLSVVAPNIGLSIIKDYEIVEKKTVETPDTLKGIVKCNNPKCITNNEPMQTLFHTVDKVLGIVRCHYCDKEQQLGKVELCK